MLYWLDVLDKLNAREAELERLLIDSDYSASHPHHPQSYRWVQEYEARNTLPFAGGLAEQPQWWLDDMTFFRLWDEYEHSLPDLRQDVHKTINRLREETTWS